MAEQERDFKGVWIPKEVWLDNRLSMLEKGMLVEIDSLDQGERGCYKSNEDLAEFCQCSIPTVTRAIAKLKQLGYIYEKSFNGRERSLKSRLSGDKVVPNQIDEAGSSKRRSRVIKLMKQSNQIDEAGSSNFVASNTSNNTLSNTISNNNIYISEFDELWQLYPRKQGKPNALKAYIKARKKGTTFEEVKQGVLNYRMHIEAKGTATEYIKHGSTWFNQEAWNDEYDLMPKTQNNGKQRGKDNVEELLKEDLRWALEIER